MRAFVTIALVVLTGIFGYLHFEEVAQNQIAKKQIAELTQRVSAVETQAQNVKVLRSDMRTLDVKIDTLRRALTSASDSPAISLSTGTNSTPVQPPTADSYSPH